MACCSVARKNKPRLQVCDGNESEGRRGPSRRDPAHALGQDFSSEGRGPLSAPRSPEVGRSILGEGNKGAGQGEVTGVLEGAVSGSGGWGSVGHGCLAERGAGARTWLETANSTLVHRTSSACAFVHFPNLLANTAVHPREAHRDGDLVRPISGQVSLWASLWHHQGPCGNRPQGWGRS